MITGSFSIVKHLIPIVQKTAFYLRLKSRHNIGRRRQWMCAKENPWQTITIEEPVNFTPCSDNFTG